MSDFSRAVGTANKYADGLALGFSSVTDMGNGVVRFTLTDGGGHVDVTVPTVKGDKGDNGTDGEDGIGIVSITKTGTVGLVDTYTITFTNGSTTTFTVTNGSDAEPQIQSDWEQTDSTKVDFIKNKPTKLSDFTNDEEFVDNTVDDLTNYYTKTETDTLLDDKADASNVYTKTETDELLNDKADSNELVVVSTSVNQNWQGNGYNLIKYPYPFTEDTNRGITFASNLNGGVIANGTVSESTLDAFTTIMNNFTLTAGTYVISDGISDSSDSKYWCTVYKQSDSSELARSTRNNGMFTLDSNTIVHVQVRVYRGTTINNVVFYPMLVKVSDDSSYPTKYQRYAMGNVEITDKVSNIQEPTITWENCTPLFEGTSFQVKNGVAYLSAHLNNVTISANTWKSFGTIPDGYRPNKSDIRFTVLIDGTTKACKGHITSTGIIGIYSSEAITESSSAFVFNLSYIVN